ncbi:MAG: SRPBCC domain-containing protein [Acidimicrobiia bacterium]
MPNIAEAAFNPELDLELILHTDIPGEAIWRAWTEPELLTKWFTPAPYITVEAEVDLRPGGIFRTVMQSPEGERIDNDGCMLRVDAPRSFTWTTNLRSGFRPNTTHLAVTATITIADDPAGGTIYRATCMHDSAEARARHEEMGFTAGWTAAFEQLVALMRTA